MAGTKAATPRKSSKSRKSKSSPAAKKPTKAAKAAPVSGTKALSSSSNAGLDRSTVQRAVAALLKHQANTAASKPAQLLDDTEYVHLVIGMRRIPDKGKNKPYPISLPHSLFSKEDPNLCLFVKDASLGAVEDELEKHPVAGFNKVMSYAQLRNNYTRYKERRKLCAQYDAFFSDDRILPMMPRLLGKVFFEKKKHPVPVRVSRVSALQHTLAKARDNTYLYLGWGPCTSVKVGRTDFTAKELVENIMAAMPSIIDHIPKNWKAIQVIHLKTASSVALPIFHSLPELHGAAEEHLPAVPKTSLKRARAGAGAGAGAGAQDTGDSDSSSIFGDEDDGAAPAPKAKATPAGNKSRGKKRVKRFFDTPASKAAGDATASAKASSKKRRRRRA